MTFDGTTRSGEAMAIILRFVNDDWMILHCLHSLQVLAESHTGEEIVRELMSVLQVDYGISPGTLVGSIHDRASINSVAMTTSRVLYPEIPDVGCFSCTIDHVGERFHTPTLSKLITAWLKADTHW